MAITFIAATFFFLTLWRLFCILPSERKRDKNVLKRKQSDTCSLAVFLGSGGHTSEALALVSGLNFQRYSPRKYIISEGDTLSAQKSVALESSKLTGSSIQERTRAVGDFSIVIIPRTRSVHQSLFTTPPSMLLSLLACVYYVTLDPVLHRKGHKQTFADVLVINGPGTCVSLCLAVYLNRFIALPSPKIIYVESFARVKSLSLSAKLLRPFVDKFIIQWPQPLIVRDRSSAECQGLLV